ncbi:uncharacterized protein [Pseudorca crassidens]|uniref:uncharacterized protein n=1 Tax=Pseudorca crassidens TaxID=82174 RepID=UPI00352DCAE4
MQQSGCKRLRGRRAGFHLARVPRRPGLLRGAEPTALPPDWKLLGGGSQSRLHYGRCPALSRWLGLFRFPFCSPTAAEVPRGTRARTNESTRTLEAKDGLLRRTQLTLLLDWAELSEVESRQSDEAVAFSVRLGDHNFDNCALRNAAEILQSPPLRGLPRGDAEGLGKEEGRRHSLAGPPRGGRPVEHWRAGARTTSPTEEDPEAF